MEEASIPAGEFKARCLQLLDTVAASLTFRRLLDAFARNFLAPHAVRVRVALPGR